MQHQILINIIIFVAYVLNLPLNTQRSHSRSQRAGKWSLILAHDRRPIYRAPTYIAVPLLGPHQPRYIGLTLYLGCWWPGNSRSQAIGSQSIDLVLAECSSFGTRMVNCWFYIDGLVQERRNSTVITMELRLSCTNSSIYFRRNINR